ncbi:hypothetical protein [Yersinia frederiksenii]|uniref:hypothetical protein n=1 Tax=Yersinia frederiksenii TaxID=29484 RepID=UPI0005E2FB4F|nr:hypothetical protein [Yersinia frederiksenii]CQH38016.1 Uncharacterised protein [Yersinia frederiksenii]
MSAKENYYAALQRLRRNQPLVLPKNSLINKDTVALEAGRRRGSIRQSRGMDDLIAAIEVASGGKTRSTVSMTKKQADITAKKKSWEDEKKMFLAEIDTLRSRNMSLLYQVYSLKQQLCDNNIEMSDGWDTTTNIVEFQPSSE